MLPLCCGDSGAGRDEPVERSSVLGPTVLPCPWTSASKSSGAVVSLSVAVRYTHGACIRFNCRPGLGNTWYFHFAWCKWDLGQAYSWPMCAGACLQDCFMVIKSKRGDAERVTSIAAPVVCLRILSVFWCRPLFIPSWELLVGSSCEWCQLQRRLWALSHFSSLAFQYPAVQQSGRAAGDAGGGQQLAESPGQPEAPRAGLAAGAVPGAGAAAAGALWGRGGAGAGLRRAGQRAAAGTARHHPPQPPPLGAAGGEALACWGAARPSHRNCSGWAFPLLLVLLFYSVILSWSLSGEGWQVLTMY